MTASYNIELFQKHNMATAAANGTPANDGSSGVGMGFDVEVFKGYLQSLLLPGGCHSHE